MKHSGITELQSVLLKSNSKSAKKTSSRSTRFFNIIANLSSGKNISSKASTVTGHTTTELGAKAKIVQLDQAASLKQAIEHTSDSVSESRTSVLAVMEKFGTSMTPVAEKKYPEQTQDFMSVLIPTTSKFDLDLRKEGVVTVFPEHVETGNTQSPKPNGEATIESSQRKDKAITESAKREDKIVPSPAKHEYKFGTNLQKSVEHDVDTAANLLEKAVPYVGTPKEQADAGATKFTEKPDDRVVNRHEKASPEPQQPVKLKDSTTVNHVAGEKSVTVTPQRKEGVTGQTVQSQVKPKIAPYQMASSKVVPLAQHEFESAKPIYSKPNAKSEPQTFAQTLQQPMTNTKAEPQTFASAPQQPVTDAKAEPQTFAQTLQQPMTNTKAEPQTFASAPQQPVTDAKSEPQTFAQTPQQPMTNTKAEPQTFAQTPQQPVTDAKSESQTMVHTPQQPVTNTKAEPQTFASTPQQPVTDTKAEPQAVDSKIIFQNSSQALRSVRKHSSQAEAILEMARVIEEKQTTSSTTQQDRTELFPGLQTNARNWNTHRQQVESKVVEPKVTTEQPRTESHIEPKVTTEQPRTEAHIEPKVATEQPRTEAHIEPKVTTEQPRSEAHIEPKVTTDQPRTESHIEPKVATDQPRTEAHIEPKVATEQPRSEAHIEPKVATDQPRTESHIEPKVATEQPRTEAHIEPKVTTEQPRSESHIEPKVATDQPRTEAHIEPKVTTEQPRTESHIEPKVTTDQPRIEAHIEPKVATENPQISKQQVSENIVRDHHDPVLANELKNKTSIPIDPMSVKPMQTNEQRVENPVQETIDIEKPQRQSEPEMSDQGRQEELPSRDNQTFTKPQNDNQPAIQLNENMTLEPTISRPTMAQNQPMPQTFTNEFLMKAMQELKDFQSGVTEVKNWAKFEISSEETGRVQTVLETENGKLQVLLVAEDSEKMKYLQDTLKGLQEHFTRLGYEDVHIEYDYDRQHRRKNEQHPRNFAKQKTTATAIEKPQAKTGRMSKQTGYNTIDYVA